MRLPAKKNSPEKRSGIRNSGNETATSESRGLLLDESVVLRKKTLYRQQAGHGNVLLDCLALSCGPEKTSEVKLRRRRIDQNSGGRMTTIRQAYDVGVFSTIPSAMPFF